MPERAPQPLPQAAPLGGVYAKIFNEIAADRTLLPSMPEVAVRMRAAMSDPAYDLAGIARIVQSDAGIAAYLIRMANSPMFRAVAPVQDVPAAIMRLGMQVTRNVVTACALRGMFRVKSEQLAAIMQESWTGSARLGALCCVLAQRWRLFTPDEALLAGLLQEIGVLPILSALERRQAEAQDSERVSATIEQLAGKVGVTLLKHWGFDAEMVEVARTRKDWLREREGAPDLADLVLVARALLGSGPARSLHDMPAFRRVEGASRAAGDVYALVEEAEREIEAMRTLLGV